MRTQLAFFLFSFSSVGRLLGLAAGHAGHQLIEGFFGGHFLRAALVVLVLVLAVTGSATHFDNFFANHRDYRMVHGAFATRTMIVDVITQSHDVPHWAYYKGYNDTLAPVVLQRLKAGTFLARYGRVSLRSPMPKGMGWVVP